MCSQRTILGLLLSVFPAAAPVVAKIEPPVRPQVVESYGKLPLSFEANRGQTDQRVKFLSRGPGYSLFLTEDSAVLSLHGKKSSAALRMKLLGANPYPMVTGTDPLPGKSNYFVGKDPNQWRTNVPTYVAVKYASVYPGIDLTYHGNQRLLEYDFVVAPGADPQAIDIRFQGAKKLSVNGEGHLVISVGDSEVIEHAPVVYQETGGQRQIVAGRYVLRGKGRVGFSVGAYDRSQPLVIDPTLEYSALLSGSAGASILGIAVDTSGSAYVTGYTNSSDFPTTPGAFQTTIGGAFVTKLNVAGSALLYSTYLGGDNAVGLSIAVDASGDTYITGCAYRNFPTTPGAFQTTYRAFNGNAFVTKLNAAGSALLYSTYLGGSSAACGVGIAIDASGDAYIAGDTYDLDFPTTAGAFQITPVGRPNAFVSKLNSAGSALVYSTFLGGNGSESGVAIAVDASGNAYVTGSTWSTNFSVTPDAFQTTSRAPDVFVSKLNAAGSALLYSTYFGGSGPDMSNAIAIDSSGSAYVIGWAGSSDFPTPPGSFQTKSGLYSPDFISKFSFGTSITGAPVTIATLSGSAGNHGWYLSGVTVTLSATDPNSSVSATYYSVDAGAYHAYGAPFSISTDGSH